MIAIKMFTVIMIFTVIEQILKDATLLQSTDVILRHMPLILFISILAQTDAERAFEEFKKELNYDN